jgi:arginine utilization protein RocB
MTQDLAELCRDLAIAMTREPSVTGTPEEARFAHWLADHLRGLDCFGAAADPSGPFPSRPMTPGTAWPFWCGAAGRRRSS